MPKKVIEKAHSHESKHEESTELERKLVENLVELQKVHADLAEKFDNLSRQISGLLTLFEMTARSFAEHPAIQATEKDKEFLDKIDKLLDQNKTIAKGLTLMEDRMKERVYGAQVPAIESVKPNEENESYGGFRPQSGIRPLPKF